MTEDDCATIIARINEGVIPRLQRIENRLDKINGNIGNLEKDGTAKEVRLAIIEERLTTVKEEQKNIREKIGKFFADNYQGLGLIGAVIYLILKSQGLV